MKKNPLIDKYKGMSVVAKATMWFMVCSLIQKGLSFITTPIFTRLLTTEQYGLFSVYTSWLQIITIFSTFRLDYSVFNKGMSKYPERRDEYTSSMLGLTTVINTVLLAVYLLFRQQINAFTELNTVIFLGMFIQLYFIPAVNFWSLRLRYEFKYKMVVIVTILMAIANAGLGILGVKAFEDKGLARILSCVLVEVIFGLIIYIRILIKGKKFWNFEFIKFAVLFNIPLIPHYFATYVIEQSDRIMIQKLVSFGAAALYSVSYTVGGLAKIFISALTNTLIPLQYRLLENKEYKELNKQLTKLMLGISCLLLCLSIVAPEIVLILGGEEYMEAVYVMPPVVASVFFSFLYTLLANVEFFFDKNKFAMKISIVGALVNVILNYLLIPVFGYVAAAYTTLLCYVIYAVGHLIYVNHTAEKQVGERIMNVKSFLALSVLVSSLCITSGFLYETKIIRYALLLLAFIIAIIKHKEIRKLFAQMK